MITKERIDELIKNKAKIYGISKSGEVFCLGLKFREHTLNNKKWLENKYEVYGKFYENKEDAEFVAKYHTSRVEKFEPPTLEEFKQGKFYHFISKDCFYSLSPNLVHGEVVIYESVHGGGNFIVYKQPLTKENYIKAVEKARKLFLGEEDA